MTENRQNGFTKGEVYLTELITFCDEVTTCMDKSKAADVLYLDFSKTCSSLL